MDLIWSRRMEKRIGALGRWYAKMAADIDIGHFDVVYVHHCALTLAPDLLRGIRRTPTVFCCNDTQRSAMQWPAATDAGYDTVTDMSLLRKRRGRLLSPAQVRFSEGLESRFITNTRAASLVLANSWYSREALAHGTGVDARVCYPGVDPDFFCPGAQKPLVTASEKTVLSVGAFLPSKRHAFVLESIAAIPLSKRPQLKILGYVGGPNSSELEASLLARARKTDVSLTICKDADEAELREAYRDAAVVAFAPYLEPFGLVAVEAMACGTPVVGVREAGVRETVTHGETDYSRPMTTGILPGRFPAS
jgi:glycosyltransferase involved in cell wall biosynthesis